MSVMKQKLKEVNYRVLNFLDRHLKQIIWGMVISTILFLTGSIVVKNILLVGLAIIFLLIIIVVGIITSIILSATKSSRAQIFKEQHLHKKAFKV